MPYTTESARGLREGAIGDGRADDDREAQDECLDHAGSGGRRDQHQGGHVQVEEDQRDFVQPRQIPLLEWADFPRQPEVLGDTHG